MSGGPLRSHGMAYMRWHMLLLLSVLALPVSAQDDRPSFASIGDTFTAKNLDTALWRPTASGLCSVAEVAPTDGRLGVRVGTLGDSDPVVWRGLRSVRPLRLGQPCELSLDIDWNNQTNGCYLQCGLFLAPVASDVTPDYLPDWWSLAYVGVPPGRNGRAFSSVRQSGGERVLYSEGWPEQREGRKIGLQRLSIKWADDAVTIWENDSVLFSLPPSAVPFPEAYLYLQVKSHSNYSARDLYFDNITFRSGQHTAR